MDELRSVLEDNSPWAESWKGNWILRRDHPGQAVRSGRS